MYTSNVQLQKTAFKRNKKMEVITSPNNKFCNMTDKLYNSIKEKNLFTYLCITQFFSFMLLYILCVLQNLVLQNLHIFISHCIL